MRNRCRSIAKDESGVTVVIIAICMTLFVSMLAYVVDIGYAYEMRRQLQSAADAAALAGMIEKINEGNEAAVLKAAKDYAKANDLVGATGVLKVTDPDLGQTIINQEDFVQIEVEKEAYFAFAPIFDKHQSTIKAQAKAIRTYVTSAGDLVPWGLVTIRPAVMYAYVDAASYKLEDVDANGEEDGTWEASLSAPGAPSRNGYLIDIKVTNGLDPPYTQPLEGVGRITVAVPGDSVSDVWLDNNNLAPGQTAVLSVASADMPTVANGHFKDASFFPSGPGIWEALLTAPAPDNSFQAYPIDIKVGGDHYKNAAVLVVQTNGSPFTAIEVDAGESHWASPGAGISLAVTVREFEEGISYTLKLDPKFSQAGNFGPLDYSTLVHWEDGEPEGINNNADYFNSLAFGYGGVVCIGDSVYTYNGDMGGHNDDALKARFADCPEDPYTLPEWEEDGKPKCGRWMVLPVYELTEDPNGKKKVVIYSFAAFFVESPSSEMENISGQFIKEFKAFGTKSSDTNPNPDSDSGALTVRLAKPNY